MIDYMMKIAVFIACICIFFAAYKYVFSEKEPQPINITVTWDLPMESLQEIKFPPLPKVKP